ncbi:MAG: PDZ domain-containing protein, partial [Coriobacteriia bacterium]|nr:PDZ domain-containing protein [Coriobacteriia bacterium]
YIIEITKGSNAEKAGLKPEDIIVSLDDEKILGMDDLLLQVRRQKIGAAVTLGVYRDGSLIEIDMTVGIKPDNLESPSQDSTGTP